ncbi:hypothetical protein BD410DRAFT_717224 [Rickenella mellea]|uniref:ATPase, V0 complex, subunit E n=1 Tax=Rickenella mellea TaxID=50990 RepID=A0A4Y7QFL8_9AGAM|nr:hypothetical protein BD410DRAFT_717224 [Rickenella mellea]
MASVLPVIFILALVLGLMACAWIVTPKGPQQTLVRTSLMLTLACCYLMWMISYMAQLHPLICQCTALRPINPANLLPPSAPRVSIKG